MQTLAEFLGTAEAPTDASQGAAPELTIRDFCRGVLSSREYRQSILDRISLGTLPPAVECRMYDYAYGKPVDRVEHTGKDGKPIETITEVRRVIIKASDRPLEDDEQQPERYTTH